MEENHDKYEFINDTDLKQELIMFETLDGTYYIHRNKYESYEECLDRIKKIIKEILKA
jgi:hypothetical protein